MKLTNIHGLPEPIVEAIRNDPYSRGDSDISITGLIGPPRISALEAQYGEHLTEDVSERIWSLFGKTVHNILEKAGRTGLREQRMFAEISGWVISGAFDHLELSETVKDLYTKDSELVLSDWKTTSVYTLFNERRLWEWQEQLNCYAYLLSLFGYEVDRIQVVALLRDWKRSMAWKDPTYPQTAVEKVPLQLWSPEEALRFIEKRVELHQAARVHLPECNDEDRWASPHRWAVYTPKKNGERKARADRVLDTEQEALDWAEGKTGAEIEERPGNQWVRCQDYCSVATFCTQYLEGSV